MQLTDPIESRIDSDVNQKTGVGKMVTVKDVLQNIQVNADRTRQLAETIVTRQVGYGTRTEDTQSRVAALQNAVVELAAKSGGMSAADIEALVTKMLQENVVKVNVDVAGSRTS